MDLAFYKGTPPATKPGVTLIYVSETIGTNPNRNYHWGSTFGELAVQTNIPRVWEDKNYLYCIPENDNANELEPGSKPGRVKCPNCLRKLWYQPHNFFQHCCHARFKVRFS